MAVACQLALVSVTPPVAFISRRHIPVVLTALHARAGMSTFSTKGGLYERAQKKFSVTNGKRLFTYSFYEKRKLEALVCANLVTISSDASVLWYWPLSDPNPHLVSLGTLSACMATLDILPSGHH